MPAAVTKQDVQSMVDMARNKIMSSQLTKYDLQLICTQVHDRILNQQQNLQQINTQMFRQGMSMIDQTAHRLGGIETRIGAMEQELKNIHTLLEQLATREPVVTVQPAPVAQGEQVPAPQGATQWQYREAY